MATLRALTVFSTLLALHFSMAMAAAPVTDTWKAQDNWPLDVRLADGSKIMVRAWVVADKADNGSATWALRFYPSGPQNLKGKWYRVVLNKETDVAGRAFREEDQSVVTVEKAGSGSFITGAPDCIPIEWFNVRDLPQGKLDVAGTKRTIEVRREDSGDKYILEMIVTDDGIEELRVKQEWTVGEKWWKTYERRVKGKVELTARRMGPAGAEDRGQKSEVGGQKTEDRGQKSEVGGQKALDSGPPKSLPKPTPATAKTESQNSVAILAADSRLEVKVRVVGQHPKLDEILSTLSAGTGLAIRGHSALPAGEDQPDLGEMYLTGTRCSSVMNYIAKKYPDGTHWVKTDDGYELTPSAIPAAEEAPKRGWGWGTIVLIAGLALAAGGVGFAGFVFWRSRGAKAAQPVPRQAVTSCTKAKASPGLARVKHGSNTEKPQKGAETAPRA